MGSLTYGPTGDGMTATDHLLAHLMAVTATKLRRNESFTLTWHDDTLGRHTLWLHPAIPLRFTFDDPEPVLLDRHVLERLAQAAGSTAGIVVDLSSPDPFPA